MDWLLGMGIDATVVMMVLGMAGFVFFACVLLDRWLKGAGGMTDEDEL